MIPTANLNNATELEPPNINPSIAEEVWRYILSNGREAGADLVDLVNQTRLLDAADAGNVQVTAVASDGTQTLEIRDDDDQTVLRRVTLTADQTRRRII